MEFLNEYIKFSNRLINATKEKIFTEKQFYDNLKSYGQERIKELLEEEKHKRTSSHIPGVLKN